MKGLALVFALAAALLTAAGASAKAPKTPDAFVVDRVHVDGIELRWDDDDLNGLKSINGDEFEIVQTQAAQVTPC